MGFDVPTDRAAAPRAVVLSLLALAALALLLIPARADAAITLSGLTAKPANTDAGAHSDFSFHIDFGGDDVKDLTVHLAPGQVADPTATPLCTVTQLNGDTCPAASQVGSVTTNATVTVVVLPVPVSVSGSLYNLTPQPGEPARFGIVLRLVNLPPPLPSVLPPVVLQSAVKLRPTDYGLDSVINNIPNATSGFPTHIDSMNVTLFGSAGNPKKPFSRNPTSCSPSTTGFDADAYGGATATGTAAYTPTNCSALDFSPTFSSSIGSKGHTAEATRPPLSTVVDQDAGEAGVQNVTAILPKGVGADTTALVRRCPLAAFQAGTCPANTVVGQATAESPYLTQSLSGPVTIVEAAPGQPLPRLGLDLQGPLHIQLFGSFVLDPQRGPGNAFMNIPDIPLSHFVLQFAADDLVDSSRDLCTGAAPAFQTSFTGWNGATQNGNVAAKVQGCSGGGGGGGGNAKPKAKVAVTKGSSDNPHLKLKVTDKAKVAKTKLKLAKGLAFAGGKATRRGVKVRGGDVVKARSRTLKATGGGAKLVEKAVAKALVRTRRIAGKKLHFKLAVTDGAGKTTKLKLVAKAKP
jgi:hypothetical protein